MDQWLGDLREDLEDLRARRLLRRLTPVELRGPTLVRDGKTLINLAGNDYLGLSQHPRLKVAGANAAQTFGTGAGASRLVSGHLTLHQQVEAQFAAFKHAEAALLLPTGFTANLAVLSSLARPGDLVCVDKLNHASLIDAAHASGAEVRVFPHLQLAKLRRLLERPRPAHSDGRAARKIIVTDSVFSMDGDVADLPALCDLADAHDAILIVDEAHGTGVLGEHGEGLCELQGVSARVDVVVSTASKALGGLGGIVTAKQAVIDALVNRARAFIYSTAVPPPQVAAIAAALEVVRDEPWRRQRVLELATRLRSGLSGVDGIAVQPTQVVTPIVPLITGSTETALALAAHLESHGFFAPAIRPPTVALGAARVRLSLRADLEPGDMDRLIDVIRRG